MDQRETPPFRADGYLPEGVHACAAAEDLDDYTAWAEFFGRTRETDCRRKGVVEIRL